MDSSLTLSLGGDGRFSCRKNDSGTLKTTTPTVFNRYFELPTRYSYFPTMRDRLWKGGPDPWGMEMVSRRKILSRSKDELNTEYKMEDEDVWFQKEKLFKDHIQEVLNKWGQIDDEIWAKVICMERNRRVAKAYARAPVLTINGSDDGFDGYRIGLCGFENPLRDAKTEEVKRHIGHGIKIKMDECGNIMVKRVSKCNVYVKEVETEDNSISNDIIRAGGLLELEKPMKVFDMKKFTSNINRELKRTYPDRRKLESQCISVISFVKEWPELLDCACWIMTINVVALDMLKSKLPPLSKRQSAPNLVSRSERSHLLLSEEDPYSVPSPADTLSTNRGGGKSLPKDAKPPKLPPRDPNRVHVPLPDYDSKTENTFARKKAQQLGYKDDPYYCGMKARVPNFAKKEPVRKSSDSISSLVHKSHSSSYLSLLRHSDRSPTAESCRGMTCVALEISDCSLVCEGPGLALDGRPSEISSNLTVMAKGIAGVKDCEVCSQRNDPDKGHQTTYYDTCLDKSDSESGIEDYYARVYGRSQPFAPNFSPGELYVGEWE